MRDFSTPRTFIFSAERSDYNPHVNSLRTKFLAQSLESSGIPFQEAEGCYEGAYERSFVVSGATHQADVFALAKGFEQDTVLVVAEHDRTAYLADPRTGYHTHLGRFKATGDALPAGDGWTCCDGVYFAVEPTKGVDLPEGI